MQSSLRWFVDNLAQIADWRATLLRIVTFRDALPTVETIGEEAGRITVVDGGADQLVLEDLAVALPDACATLDQTRVEVRPGERIQILGKPGIGKSTVFRALAGMWPWGAGRIQLPPREAMMYMPQRPYLPLGTLRAAVSYPAEPGRFEDAAVRAALARVDLGISRSRSTAQSAGTGSCRWTSSSAWRSRDCCCTRRAGSCSTTRSAPSTRSPRDRASIFKRELAGRR